jgi:hypothetical protein
MTLSIVCSIPLLWSATRERSKKYLYEFKIRNVATHGRQSLHGHRWGM